MRAPARVLGAIGLIALPLFAAPAAARAQARWTPRLGIGLTRWLGDVGEESPPLALAARAQLLRSAEGSFAWGPEVACYTFGTYDTSPGLFVELRGHGALVEDDGFVGGGAFLSLMGGVSH
ncbi:MAG: hypothetical protein R6X22_04755 [Gemmatimonadota bacterium]